MNNKQQYAKTEQAQACLHKSPFARGQILRLFSHLSHNKSIYCRSLKIGNIIVLYLSWRQKKPKQNKTQQNEVV